MATLGRWTGSGAYFPTTSWTSPNGLFGTQARNDGSAYTMTASTSTVTLPSSGLADGYLLVVRNHINCSHNNRNTNQDRILQTGGTGNFANLQAGSYERNNNNDENYSLCMAFVDSPSASATFQYSYRREVGDGTPAGAVTRASFDVIPLYYSDVGIYTSTTAELLGGTTPNAASIATTTLEGTAITRSGTTVSVTGDNKRYMVLGSHYAEGRSGRTQRWIGPIYDGTLKRSATSYQYWRDAGTDNIGVCFTDIMETVTATRTIQLGVYRGDGIANNQGGADSDGNTPSAALNTLVVLELNDSAEVFKTEDGTGGQDLIPATITDLNISRTTDIEFNDSGSWTRSTDTAMNAEQAMDALVGATAGGAYNAVSSGTRATGRCDLTVNGTEDADVYHGGYGRGAQSSTDTFGYSANPVGFVALASGDDVGFSVVNEGDSGPVDSQANWVGAWGINLDSLEPATGALTASGTPTLASPTASGTATIIKRATGAATMAAVACTGAALLAPKVYLNATETLSGATEMTVTSWNTAGTSITFTDPAGPPTGSLSLGVENRNIGGGDSNTGWINVTVSTGGALTASGTPSILAATSSGVVNILVDADGTPSLEAITASGTVTKGALTGSGTPSTEVITASGGARFAHDASGAPSVAEITASGQATLGALAASGAPLLDALTASGVARFAHDASGTPSIAEILATGTARFAHEASGTPSLVEIAASGVASLSGQVTASGSPSLDVLTASGLVTYIHQVSGTPSIDALTSAGTARFAHEASGTASLETITATGSATLQGLVTASGTPSIAGLVASGSVTYTHNVSGAPSIASPTAAGSVVQIKRASGTPSLATILADGDANRPRVWLNTTQTVVGATEMTVTAWSNTSITFTDPIGAPLGSLWLGVENTRLEETAWIAVTVNSSLPVASGTPSLTTITASGVAVISGNLAASGTPSLDAITASGVAGISGTLTASGTPSLEAVTASGLVNVFGGSEGFPTLDVITASGTASIGAQVTASGTPVIEALTATGQAVQTYRPSGTPSVDTITASGVATLGAKPASGTPSISVITAQGTARFAHDASGTPSIEAITAAGTVTQRQFASGSAVLIETVASGVVILGRDLSASGTPSLAEVTAVGLATVGVVERVAGRHIRATVRKTFD